MSITQWKATMNFSLLLFLQQLWLYIHFCPFSRFEEFLALGKNHLFFFLLQAAQLIWNLVFECFIFQKNIPQCSHGIRGIFNALLLVLKLRKLKNCYCCLSSAVNSRAGYLQHLSAIISVTPKGIKPRPENQQASVG